MTMTLVRTSYVELLEEVRKVLAEGRARARRALEHEEIRTWWEAARVINETLRRHGGRAAYGKKTVKKLALDLGITEQYLYDVLRFQQHFKILNSSLKLTLTHYRIMARLEDPRERYQLYLKVRRENLSIPGLVEEIRKRKLLSGPELELSPSPSESKRGLTPFGVLKPRRGRFYTYRIVKPRDLHEGPDFYSVDLGFGNRIDLRLSGIPSPKEGDVIEAVRTLKNKMGDRYRFKRAELASGGPRRLKDLLYTYKATVRDVLDDDTLWADIDLGFRVWTEQKLRLRGIDAAELEKGKPASDFVKRTLARVPFVVLTISGRDKFGRPLADLFYLEGTEDREKILREGTYLSQELLDRGLARRV
jgi:endonuclease YncB( thermonuclease family)